MKFVNIIKKNRSGIISCYLERYINYLLEKKYNTWTIYHSVEHIQRFIKYIQKRGISLSIVSPYIVDKYLKYHHRMFQRKHKRIYKNQLVYPKMIKSSINQFICYLSQNKVIKLKYRIKSANSSLKNVPYQYRNIVKEYLNYCSQQRGLKQATIRTYKFWILRLVNFLNKKHTKDICSLGIAYIDEFISRYNSGLKRGSINFIQSVLRNFFRFIYMYDYIDRDLSEYLFSSKTYNQRLLPKHVSWNKIETIIKQVNTDTNIGKRDYAILVLLSSYGLRPSEVTKLKLSDIYFKEKKIIFRNRKSGKDLILPLMENVSRAILEYLRIRPEADVEEVFVSAIAPYRRLIAQSISSIIIRYIKKAKLNVPIKGAYLFRHSFAKRLLDKGVSIEDIASLLGHSCITSTMNYIRISTEELREVTDNYANLL